PRNQNRPGDLCACLTTITCREPDSVLTRKMQNWIDNHGLIFGALLVIWFAAVWCLACVSLSRANAWRQLSRHFRTQAPFPAARWTFQSGYMRYRVRMGNVLTVGADCHGLYLAVLPLFRLGHPPLLIPWSEIEVSRTRILFRDMVRFELGKELGVPLSIRP